jgi:hypothetical protein
MSYIQQIEEQEYQATYNPADRFAGFDRGDAGREEENDHEAVVWGQEMECGQMLEVVQLDDGFYVQIDGAKVSHVQGRRATWTIAKWWLSGCPA